MGDKNVYEQPDRTFQYLIDINKKNDEPPMKNISLANLPNFREKSPTNPDEILFEFKVLCQTYDYTTSLKKLKLFPSALKESCLIWFMGLQPKSITIWEEIKNVFMDK